MLKEIIENRYSCRAYTDQPVSQQDLEYIKESVRLAPSAVNKQPWKFRIVTSEEGRKKVQSTYRRDWLHSAPVYIVASVLHDEEWVRFDGKHHGDIDVAIAVEHLCLAATELGLGTCWVCNFDAALMKTLFDFAENEEPTVIIPLGHPACEISPKKRKNMEDVFIEKL